MEVDSIVSKTRDWLGTDGISFFKDLCSLYGDVSPVYMEGNIPHSVHFREGMQVRNFLRTLDECNKWNSHDFDNNWENIVLKAIE